MARGALTEPEIAIFNSFIDSDLETFFNDYVSCEMERPSLQKIILLKLPVDLKSSLLTKLNVGIIHSNEFNGLRVRKTGCFTQMQPNVKMFLFKSHDKTQVVIDESLIPTQNGFIFDPNQLCLIEAKLKLVSPTIFHN